MISVGFMYQVIHDPRKKGAFGQSIWWKHLRPFHAITYLLASMLIYNNNNKLASIILYIDVTVGTIFHIYNRYLRN
jgi:hypothetical protein